MKDFFSDLSEDISEIGFDRPVAFSGKVNRFDGNIIQCDGFPAHVGTLCKVRLEKNTFVTAEIIGFNNGQNILSLYESGSQIKVGALVTTLDEGSQIPVSEELLGRVIDALGNPLDGIPLPKTKEKWPLKGTQTNPLLKTPIDAPLDVGVRAINSLVSVGRGQRIGIIAGSGVGKSVLLGMMSKYTTADVVVVGLIGERGREVGSFVKGVLDSDSKSKTCIVAVPADRSPLLRIRGADRATAIAEYFRAKGKHVLLIMDSLTRVAHAQREIGLALGEQATAKGYPPSVISLLPKLIERSGTGMASEGTITAFYTVLADGDDANDPVVDTSRAILDGHILLSRSQTQLGIYPAIDVPLSVSRVMNEITQANHQEYSRLFKKYLSLYMENRDLILMGGYESGQDEELDTAISLWPKLREHIEQAETTKSNFESSVSSLIEIFESK
jgi:flagellum-specific ATP synthase